MRALGLVALLVVWSGVCAAQSVEPERDPGENAMKSILLPGWGQFTNGQPTKGRAYLGTTLLMVAFWLDLIPLFEGNDAKLLRGIGVVGHLLTAGSAGYDAYSTSVRLNRENGYLIQGSRDPTLRIGVLTLRF